jgi:PAS domain S-box-containing protein
MCCTFIDNLLTKYLPVPVTSKPQTAYTFLQGGGEMGELIRNYDWSLTPIGRPDSWPQPLRVAVSIMLNSRFPMFLFWGPELISFYNDAFRPSLGIEGKHPWALGKKGKDVWEEIWPTIKPWLDEVLGGGAIWMEDQLVGFYRNGRMEDIYWTFSYSPISDEEGKPAGVFVTCTETTEKVQRYQKLKAANEQFEHLVMQAPVAIAVFRGPDFRAEVVNDAYLPLIGKRREEIVGQPLFDVIPETRAVLEPLALEVVRTGTPFSSNEMEVMLLRNGREERCYFNFIWEPVRNLEGVVDGFMAIGHEITGQVQARKRAEESEHRIRSFVESAPFPIGVYTGREMIIRFVNQTILEAWGKGNDVVGKTFAEVLPELKGQGVYEQLDGVYTTGVPYHARNRRIDLVIHGQLQTFYFNYSYTPLFDSDGKIYGVMNTAADVTDLNVAKRKLEESEARFHLLADAMPQFVWTANARGELDYFNKAIYEYTGLEHSQLEGGGWLQVIHPEEQEENLHLWTRAVATGEDYIVRHRFCSKDGDYRWQLTRAVPFRNAKGDIVMWIGTSTDIHEQKLFEEELNRQVEERTRELEGAKEKLLQANRYLQQIINNFESALAVLVPVYEEGRIVDFVFKMTNTAYNQYAHCSPEAIQHRRVSEIFPGYYQTDAFERYIETFETGKPNAWDLHYDVDKLDVYLQVMATRMGDDLVVHFIDYTRLKNLQLDLLRKIGELERSNRNLEEFAYAASHDLKEPIRKIHFFAGKLKQDLEAGLSPQQLQLFNRLEVSTGRMHSLVDDLLSYSQVSIRPRVLEELDLGDLVRFALTDLELEIEEKKATIHIGELPVVQGHMRQLQQLFQNLLSNALKYNKAGVPPVIHITSHIIKGSGSEYPLPSELRTKDFYQVEVTDNGIGFDPQHAEKIFQVFQRLHGNTEYKGTGVGLAIARKVAENHGGFLWAKGEVDKGARFILLLPAEGEREK